MCVKYHGCRLYVSKVNYVASSPMIKPHGIIL